MSAAVYIATIATAILTYIFQLHMIHTCEEYACLLQHLHSHQRPLVIAEADGGEICAGMHHRHLAYEGRARHGRLRELDHVHTGARSGTHTHTRTNGIAC